MNGDVLFYWILIPAVKIVCALLGMSLVVALFTYLERKIIGFIQVRIGPRRVGPHGILQPIADVAKLFLKEDIVPTGSHRILFILAPCLAIVPAFLAIAVFPFGPDIADWTEKWYSAWLTPVASWLGADLTKPLPMVITDVDIGLLFIIAISSLGVFSLLVAGWASNSKYPLLGGLRSAAQMISYEVPLGFALVAGLMMTRTLSMNGIIETQQQLGWSLVWLQPISLLLYMIAGVAETNRVPFDLPEAENELVAGFHTEYSGMKFAFFFLAEYINMVTVTVIATTVFLGGWLPPLHGLWRYLGGGQPVGWMAWAYSPPMAFVWFVVKVGLLYYIYFWLRATLPRYRYDQLMALGWKWMIPVSLLNVFLVGGCLVVAKVSGLPLLAMSVVQVVLFIGVVYMVRSVLRGSHGKQAVGTVH